MNDDALKEALIHLYAHDSRGAAREKQEEALRARCRQVIWNRLNADGPDFRSWISTLVRDMYLSDAALADGQGIEEACEFWAWFDKTMWKAARPAHATHHPDAPTGVAKAPLVGRVA